MGKVLKKECLTNSTHRIGYIDIMKGLAIFYVVMGHVLAWAYSDWKESVTQNFAGTVVWNVIYSFHMPLFMFLSGYVVFNPAKKYLVKDIAKRIIQYLIPFFAVGTLLYYYRNDPAGIFNYWYLRALAEYVIVLYIINIIFEHIPGQKKILDLFQVLSFLLAFYLINLFLQENSLMDWILCKMHMNLYFYFIIGWYLRRNDYLENIILNNNWIFPVSLFVIYVYVVWGVQKHTLLTISGIFATYTIARFLVRTHLSKLFIRWGEKSLEIYILHFFLLFSAPVVGQYFLTLSHLPTAIVMQLFYGIVVSTIITSISVNISSLFYKNEILSLIFFGKLYFLRKQNENSTT